MTFKDGDLAPEFKVPTDNGKTITLSDLKGQKVVLYFYPKDDTPGCTLEAQDFSANIKEFQKKNTLVLGISKDSIDSHCKFKAKYTLAVLFASDQEGVACEAYGVWKEKSMYGKKYMGIERSTFLIDETGKLLKSWRNVKVPGHVEAVLQAISS